MSDIQHRNYVRLWRLWRYARGLTCKGKPRKSKKHPELFGLTRREYHAAYMRKRRAQKAIA